MDEGHLVPDEVVIGMVEDKINSSSEANGFIFDGFPRTVPQAIALDKLLDNLNAPISAMLMLEVPQQELIDRLILRGKSSGRVDDQNIEKINTRIKVYEEETLPVANYYREQGKLNPIEGLGDIQSIFGRLQKALDK